jgi:hypothetical protein
MADKESADTLLTNLPAQTIIPNEPRRLYHLPPVPHPTHTHCVPRPVGLTRLCRAQTAASPSPAAEAPRALDIRPWKLALDTKNVPTFEAAPAARPLTLPQPRRDSVAHSWLAAHPASLAVSRSRSPTLTPNLPS